MYETHTHTHIYIYIYIYHLTYKSWTRRMLFIFSKKVIEMKFESYKCVDSNFAMDTTLSSTFSTVCWSWGLRESQFYFHYLQSTTSTNCGKSFVTELVS